jgi:Family of unknown function (DUF6941)
MVTILGLFLCEQVIVDRHSQNPSLINSFTGRGVDQFPSSPQRFSAFAALTEGSGSVTIELAAVRLDTLERVYTQRLDVLFPNPLTVVHLSIRIRQLRFPVAGHYDFMLLEGGEIIAQRRIRVYQLQETE